MIFACSFTGSCPSTLTRPLSVRSRPHAIRIAVEAGRPGLLALQYWVVWYHNPAKNDHEGDWEHISVSITSHARQDPATSQRGLLTAEEVRALLDPVAPTPLDSLRLRNVAKGDRVTIYMPMIPEAAYAMLACARIGAIHSVVFGGFAANELAARIDDAAPKIVVAASCGLEPGRIVAYQPLIDGALRLASRRPSLARAARNFSRAPGSIPAQGSSSMIT